jgi:hypothetical protein
MKLSKPLIAFMVLTLLSAGAFPQENNCTSNCTAPANTGQVIGFVAAAIGLVVLTFGGVYWLDGYLERCDAEPLPNMDFKTYGTPLRGST